MNPIATCVLMWLLGSIPRGSSQMIQFTEVGGDLAHFSSESVSPTTKTFKQGDSFSLQDNDYAVGPMIPSHGKVKFHYLKHNSTKRIAACLNVLGIPVKYFDSRSRYYVGCRSPPSGVKFYWRHFTPWLTMMSFFGTIQCLEDPVKQQNVAVPTWDITIQGGLDPTCVQAINGQCIPYVPELSSPLVSNDVSKMQNQRRVPWLDTAWAVATDDTYPYKGHIDQDETETTERDNLYPWGVNNFDRTNLAPKIYTEWDRCIMHNARVDSLNTITGLWRTSFLPDNGVLPFSQKPTYPTRINTFFPGLVERGQFWFESSLGDTRFGTVPRTFYQSVYLPMRVICSLDKTNFYIYACLNITMVNQFADQLNVASGSSNRPRNILNNIFTNPPISQDMWSSTSSTLHPVRMFGQIAYQSPEHGMQFFLNLRQRQGPVLRSLTGTQPQLPSPAVASFFILPNEELFRDYKQRLLLNSIWTGSLRAFFGRIDAGDAIFREAPFGRNGTTQCNILPTNENTKTATGLCVCDRNWIGDACDIPWPRKPDGTRYTALEILRETGDDDKYQVCSNRGAPYLRKTIKVYRLDGDVLIEESATDVPICKCAPGFRGAPDNWEDLPLYASMFHLPYLAMANERRGGSITCYRQDVWATNLVRQKFRTEKFVRDVTSRAALPCTSQSEVNKYIVPFDWNDVMMTRQCMIYEEDLTKPNLQVQFDYASYPWAHDVTDAYERRTTLWPVPSTSEYLRNAADFGHTNVHSTGGQGLKCWDYKEQAWDAMQTNTDTPARGIGKVADLIKYLRKDPRWRNMPTTTLFGGKLCRPCPECNRTNSVCRDVYPINDTSGTYCHCDDNFCGPTCDKLVCPTFQGKICGFGTCMRGEDIPVAVRNNGKTASDLILFGRCGPGFPSPCFMTNLFAAKCNFVVPGWNWLAAGICQCDNGYESDGQIPCSRPVCPVGLDGKVCSGSSRGTCDHGSRQCVCNDLFGGAACERKSCPRHPVTRQECSGVTSPGTSNSVCDATVDPPVCRCHLTTPDITDSDTTLSGNSGGYPFEVGYTTTKIFLDGRWGTACENSFASQCMDSNGQWCGTRISPTGTVLEANPGFAGCYNRTCRALGTASAGLECKPSCQCTTEFSAPNNPYCTVSVCGPQRCDNSNGTDSGDCRLRCSIRGNSGQLVTCSVPALNNPASNMELRASCECKIADGNFWFKESAVVDSTDPCEFPASACYAGPNRLPCNGNGQCLFNSSSSLFTCLCNTGYQGTNCSIPPVCLTPNGNLCDSATQFCFRNGNDRPFVCTCPRTYLRDANRTCSQERCLSTGGQVTSTGECVCPREDFYSDVPYLPTDVTQTQMGCRKGCPVNPTTGVACGALESGVDAQGRSFRRSRCLDILSGDPIFNDSPRPAPSCSCDFRGLDHTGKLNFFINDTSNPGGCMPRCNPAGLCVGSDCKGRGTLSPSNACNCGPNWQGAFCNIPVCNGKKDPLRWDTTTCTCKMWCHAGSECEQDLCAASGGVCNPSNPLDCDCSGNSFLTLRVDNVTFSQRQCTSKCQNGGVLNAERTACICPFPFYGDFCEHIYSCPIQWSGFMCNISECFNGGTPRPLDEVGCDCPDSYYSGLLCEEDACAASPQRVRTNSTTCNCATGFTGTTCSESICGIGGLWSPRTGRCICYYGYLLSANLSYCELDVALRSNCAQGIYERLPDGGARCKCFLGFTGATCNISACQLPQIPTFQYPDGTTICSCPPSTQGVGCQQTLCTAHSIGSVVNPVTGVTECQCLPGYAPSSVADSNGVFQCVEDMYYCSVFGGESIDFSNPQNPTCVCKEGYTGPRCENAISALEDLSGDSWFDTTRVIAITAGGVAVLGLLAWICWRGKLYSRIGRLGQSYVSLASSPMDK